MAQAGAAHAAKRWLYLIHRWIGIATCLLFLVWFLSGLVMVYVPFPGLSAAERTAGLPAIDWRKVRLGPAAAERIASPDAPPRSLSLEMIAGDPVWRIVPAEGVPVTLSAETGQQIAKIGAARAVRIAAAFGRADVLTVERLQRDQWTVAGGYDAHRPLYRARLAGPGGRDLYVSGTSGAVVLDTAARERFWNWLGSVPHWIYPTVLRQDNAAWRQVVMWVSGPCILVAITGMWIGILRTRIGRRRFQGGRVTPYGGWMLWHYVAGLSGGVLLTLWIFSGWLSVDPGRLFASPGIAPAARAAFLGAGDMPDVSPSRIAAAAPGAGRMEFLWAAGRAWAIVDRPEGSLALDAATLRPARIARADLVAAAGRLVPSAPIVAVERLTAPDLYWYDVAALPQLPVLRIKFADAAGTWVHLDPATGRLLDSGDRRRRAYRWVFDLFHKWDLNLLTLHRPAWDGLLWVFSLAGIVTSVSGIWVGWRRLRGRPAMRPRRTARGTADAARP